MLRIKSYKNNWRRQWDGVCGTNYREWRIARELGEKLIFVCINGILLIFLMIIGSFFVGLELDMYELASQENEILAFDVEPTQGKCKFYSNY
jgi:hypothetical protein